MKKKSWWYIYNIKPDGRARLNTIWKILDNPHSTILNNMRSTPSSDVIVDVDGLFIRHYEGLTGPVTQVFFRSEDPDVITNHKP